MAQHFQYQTRHFRHTALAVVGFPQLTTRPFRRQPAQVIGQLRLYPVGQVTVDRLSVSAVAQRRAALVIFGGINHQRTDNRTVVSAVLTVCMQRQTQIRQRVQMVHPQRPALHVVFVFIAAVDIPYR